MRLFHDPGKSVKEALAKTLLEASGRPIDPITDKYPQIKCR